MLHMSLFEDPSLFENFHGLPLTMDNADDVAMSDNFSPLDAGASPFPASEADALVPGLGARSSFGSVSNLPGGSTLTEFTKRKNWAAKVVEELRDLLQVLDSKGRISHVSPSITALTGYQADDVTNRFLRDLIHPDDLGVFVSEMNESIATGAPLHLFYRLRKKDGSFVIVESVGHAHIAAPRFAPNPSNLSPFCQAVFLMSRPYPTKNASMLDSFLEHKMENERLKRRVAELRREEAEELDEAQRTWTQSQEGRSDVTPSEDTMVTTLTTGLPPPPARGADGSMPPPERPAPLNIALTRENLEGIASGRPDSIGDKMARYEGATHADTIEMLTGLRYQEGERSRGISTGNGSPTLIKGDAGIAIPMDRDLRAGEKKKKHKAVEEYVCTDCGTS